MLGGLTNICHQQWQVMASAKISYLKQTIMKWIPFSDKVCIEAWIGRSTFTIPKQGYSPYITVVHNSKNLLNNILQVKFACIKTSTKDLPASRHQFIFR